MSPTIVLKRRQAGAGDGFARRQPHSSSRGGAGDPSTSSITKWDIADAVAAPRLHHQWLPDEVADRTRFPEDVLAELKEQSHRVIDRRPDLDQIRLW